MTVAADAAIPEAADAASARGFPWVDLRLVQLVVENAATGPEERYDGPGDAEATSAMLVEQISMLESMQHTLAALQATLTRRFARQHVATRVEAGETDPAKLERSVVAQIGLACRVSPTQARQRVRTARDLHDGLTHVRGLFAAGGLASPKVDTVVRATRDLDSRERGEVDRSWRLPEPLRPSVPNPSASSF